MPRREYGATVSSIVPVWPEQPACLCQFIACYAAIANLQARTRPLGAFLFFGNGSVIAAQRANEAERQIRRA